MFYTFFELSEPLFKTITCLQMYKNTDLQEEKDRIIRSFSSITDPDLIDDALKFTQSVIWILIRTQSIQ